MPKALNLNISDNEVMINNKSKLKLTFVLTTNKQTKKKNNAKKM